MEVVGGATAGIVLLALVALVLFVVASPILIARHIHQKYGQAVLLNWNSIPSALGGFLASAGLLIAYHAATAPPVLEGYEPAPTATVFRPSPPQSNVSSSGEGEASDGALDAAEALPMEADMSDAEVATEPSVGGAVSNSGAPDMSGQEATYPTPTEQGPQQNDVAMELARAETMRAENERRALEQQEQLRLAEEQRQREESERQKRQEALRTIDSLVRTFGK